MPGLRFAPDALERLVADVFAAVGCAPPEDRQIARCLVESNLVGHDSHGVIRVPPYVRFLREGNVVPNRRIEVLLDAGCLAVVDGQFGFGQSIGRQAIDLGIERCRRHGVAVVALRNCGHLGRIGDWAEQAAAAGLISLHFVNTSGLGLLVAPYGGIDRRLSANPIAAGIPRDPAPPVVLDISTSAIAEGKVRVAFNKGVPAPQGCLIDHDGRPITDPAVFYGDPPGAILPFGGHKGYGLGLIAELLAGALTGGGCSRQGVTRLSNGMLSILLDPLRFHAAAPGEFARDVETFLAFVKSSRVATPGGEVLLPGELEQRTRATRLAEGIELDATTWEQIVHTARAVGLAADRLRAPVVRPA